MADQHVSRRATGVLRWLGVLALLLGIAAMHAGVFSVATTANHDLSIVGAGEVSRVAADAMRTATAPDMTGSATASPTTGSAATPDRTESATLLASRTVGHSMWLLPAAMGSHPSAMHVQHACEVFTLAAAVLLLGLILIGWLSRAPESARLPCVGSRRAHRARPPPWTVPSLAQLSILRI